MWYRKIPFKRSKSDRSWDAKRYGYTQRNPPKPVRPSDIFKTRYSSDVVIQGYKAKVISRMKIAEFLGVSFKTVRTWDYLGVLPEPFMTKPGSKNVPLFLSAQVRCLAMVVNDFTEAGFVQIQWAQYPDHCEMLAHGYAQTLHAFNKRMEHDPLEATDKFGVVLSTRTDG